MFRHSLNIQYGIIDAEYHIKSTNIIQFGNALRMTFDVILGIVSPVQSSMLHGTFVSQGT